MSSPPDRRSGDAEEMRRSGETHRVIKGRRWRVSDPALADPVRQHLVDELTHGRRAVNSALASSDSSDVEAAHERVHDAKVALGERGPKWWEPMTQDDADVRVAAFIRAIGDRLGDVDEHRALASLRLN